MPACRIAGVGRCMSVLLEDTSLLTDKVAALEKNVATLTAAVRNLQQRLRALEGGRPTGATHGATNTLTLAADAEDEDVQCTLQ